MDEKKESLSSRLEWSTIIIPAAMIVILCALFIIFPDATTSIIGGIRGFLGDQFGFYYIIMCLGFFGVALYMAFSRFGKIKLGNIDKPEYTNFQWGAMIFTSTLGSDLILYSFGEWTMYSQEAYFQSGQASLQQDAMAYSFMHWGPMAWSIYIVLAVSFAFMLYVRGRDKQKFSEGVRPLLGNKVDGIWGKVIDLVAIFALFCGASTTYSMTTPLLAGSVAHIFNIPNTVTLSVIALVIIALVYTISVLFGMKGINNLSTICTYVFFALLAYVLFFGGEFVYIVDSTIESLGRFIDQFIPMATRTDPLREHYFAQNWTIFYWAFWLAWAVANPFFIGKISKGRTVKNLVLGGLFWGVAGSMVSFAILGNYGMALQFKEGIDIAGIMASTGSVTEAIMAIIDTLPLPKLVLAIVFISMVCFTATTFDAMAMIVSVYSYKRLGEDEEPQKFVRITWSILFIMFPILLIFFENSFSNLQSVSIIGACPIAIIITLIIISFFKDARKYEGEQLALHK